MFIRDLPLKLKTLRLEAGKNFKEMAFQLGCSAQTVSNWECGNNRPSLFTLTIMLEYWGYELRIVKKGE